MLHGRSTLNRTEEAKQREPTHEHDQSVATFMAPDSHFTWRSSVIWLGCGVVLVVVASCRVKTGGPRAIVAGSGQGAPRQSSVRISRLTDGSNGGDRHGEADSS